MAHGGIYDHLGGGFARYSVDNYWLVPHFEKMLYDNALLADAYLDGYLVTGDREYARVARETLDYVLRDMTDSSGGFHSTEDADSEGEEGKFYTWTADEINQALPAAAAEQFCYVYGVTPEGNFEGKNILNLTKTVAQCARIKGWDEDELDRSLAQSRATLKEIRDQRQRPAKDDKVLVSWNALMIHAMARGGRILGDQRYLEAAKTAVEFVFGNLRRADGRLLHAWRHGQAKYDAYLDDYSYLINALVTLYEASFDERWIDEAVRLADVVLRHFYDPDDGGFYYTADDHEQLIARNKDLHDNATPSANAMAATALLRLGKLCGRDSYLQAAAGTLELGSSIMKRSAIAGAQLLNALDFHLGPTPEIFVMGGSDSAQTLDLLNDLQQRFMPNRVIACRFGGQPGYASEVLGDMFTGKRPLDDAPTVYVCQNNRCEAPLSGPDAIERLESVLEKSGRRTSGEQ
jgi:uncharacterized protein YyaL (SSP411 family)